eukprot:scaffold118539_cov71-Phaeocystis_antarctica.AAC.2
MAVLGAQYVRPSDERLASPSSDSPCDSRSATLSGIGKHDCGDRFTSPGLPNSSPRRQSKATAASA